MSSSSYFKLYVMRKIIIIFISSLFIFSCYNEEPVTATPGDESIVDYLTLSEQGSGVLTERLQGYFNKYDGLLVLYDYDTLVYRYEVKKPNYEWMMDLPKEENVASYLDFLDEYFLGMLGDEAIKEFMPRKLLLAEELYYFTYDSYFDKYNRRTLSYSMGKFSITFTDVDGSMATKTTDQKLALMKSLIKAFIDNAIIRGLIVRPVEFGDISEYQNSAVNATNFAEYGFMENDYNAKRTPHYDFVNVIKNAIYKTPETLNSTSGPLHPSNDKNGLTKEKYDMVIEFFLEEFGIDLVKIAEYTGMP